MEHSDRGLLNVQGGLSIRRLGAPHHHIAPGFPSQEISTLSEAYHPVPVVQTLFGGDFSPRYEKGNDTPDRT